MSFLLHEDTRCVTKVAEAISRAGRGFSSSLEAKTISFLLLAGQTVKISHVSALAFFVESYYDQFVEKIGRKRYTFEISA